MGGNQCCTNGHSCTLNSCFWVYSEHSFPLEYVRSILTCANGLRELLFRDSLFWISSHFLKIGFVSFSFMQSFCSYHFQQSQQLEFIIEFIFEQLSFLNKSYGVASAVLHLQLLSMAHPISRLNPKDAFFSPAEHCHVVSDLQTIAQSLEPCLKHVEFEFLCCIWR